MAETVEVSFEELQGIDTIFDAAFYWAERNEVPTWNEWVSLISQLRRTPMTRSLLECEGVQQLQRHRAKCCATLCISYMAQGGSLLVDRWLTFPAAHLAIEQKSAQEANAQECQCLCDIETW